MILPDFVLPSRINQRWIYSGMDSPEKCANKKHFKNYPYQITYEYNSRGFRDAEWPSTIDELKECIWCFGDSFTVGLGSPLEHTWVNYLQKETGHRCINISLDGASNRWILRKVSDVINLINPKNIVVHYSYTHRTESLDTSLSDEQRRLFSLPNVSIESEVAELRSIIETYLSSNKNTNIIQSFIPNANATPQIANIWNDISGESWPSCPTSFKDFIEYSNEIKTELKNYFPNEYNSILACLEITELTNNPIFVQQLDYARDYHHYDILTARNFVSQIIPKLI
jgi:hypothetical protein